MLQPFNVVVLALTALLLLPNGLYTSETLLLMVIVLPATMIGAQLGLPVFRRLGGEQFRFLLIVLMFTSGAILGLREIMRPAREKGRQVALPPCRVVRSPAGQAGMTKGAGTKILFSM